MRSATISLALVLCLAFVAAGLQAQETTPSLGELARKERERKQQLSQAAAQIQDVKFSPEEKIAYANIEVTVSAEQNCREGLGKYVSWEQLFEGCGSKGTAASMNKEDDPRRDPNYDYRLTAGADKFELSAVPQRAGLGGLFSDGKKIYFNSQGAASHESSVIRDFSSPASSAGPQSSQAAVGSKKVYTEEDLQSLRGTISVGGGQATPATLSGEASSAEGQAVTTPHQDKDVKLSREEACGTVKINDIVASERLFCGYSSIPSAKRTFCPLEELEPKVREDRRTAGYPLPADWSLRRDSNYEYSLIDRGDRLDVAAVPQRAGLGGFYCSNAGIYGEEQCYYNSQGAASTRDIPVTESSMSGMGCTQ